MTTNNKKNDKNSKFLRLPIDLIRVIATFLNEKDVFNFEQGCDLFYQIINNLLYLKQSNNFRTFYLTLKRLDQMSQAQNNFFKYRLPDTLVLQLSRGEEENIVSPNELDVFVAEFEKKWYKVRKMENESSNNNEWITNMLKSIKSLELDSVCSVLLNLLPVDILFDPNGSHLETIELNQEMGHEYVKFGSEYLKFKRKLAIQGEKIRVLKCIKCKYY